MHTELVQGFWAWLLWLGIAPSPVGPVVSSLSKSPLAHPPKLTKCEHRHIRIRAHFTSASATSRPAPIPLPFSHCYNPLSTSCAVHSISDPSFQHLSSLLSSARPPVAAERPSSLWAAGKGDLDFQRPCQNPNSTRRLLRPLRKRRYPFHGPQYRIPFLAGIVAGYAPSFGQLNRQRRLLPPSKPPSALRIPYGPCDHIDGRITMGNT